MRNNLVLLLISLACTALSGCQTTPPPEVQIRYQQVATLPPDDLLVDCPPTPLFNFDDYLKLTDWPAKEAVWFDNTSLRIQNDGKCNNRWATLRQWKVDAQKAVDTANAASAPASSKSP